MRSWSVRRKALLFVLGFLTLAAAIISPRWKAAMYAGGQKSAKPFRIAGNLYYVGASDVTSFLLTGRAGHVLIDGGYPGTAPMIIRSIEELGFNIRDVKLLLNSHAHPDHAGGLAALKRASGAKLWVSEQDADIVEAGGDGAIAGVLRPFVWLGLINFPPAHVDARFKDGARLRVGSTEVIAHLTPGHTPGCTSWSFSVQEGARHYRVVEICSLGLPPNLTPFASEPYPGFQHDYQRSIRTLRSLEPDIWLTPHAKDFGSWRKFQARRSAKDPVAPFVDRAGYTSYIDRFDRRFRVQYQTR